MSKIEELTYIPNCDQYGNCYGQIPPSTHQIVDKINEIVEWINNQEGGKDENSKLNK